MLSFLMTIDCSAAIIVSVIIINNMEALVALAIKIRKNVSEMFDRSFIYSTKSRSLKLLPCGTPHFFVVRSCGFHLNKLLLIF